MKPMSDDEIERALSEADEDQAELRRRSTLVDLADLAPRTDGTWRGPQRDSSMTNGPKGSGEDPDA